MITIETRVDKIREVSVTCPNQQVFAFITMGATWTKWKASDGSDLVARYADYRQYQEAGMYLGTTVGPIAGRIRNSEYHFGHQDYHVTSQQQHLLHSAEYGFSFINFDLVKAEETKQGAIVVFQTKYPHPFMKGEIAVSVTYRIDASGLTLLFEARSSEDTLLNMTNHTYFNLDGDYDHPLTSHQLKLHADQVVLVDDDIIGTDAIPVENTIFDFTEYRALMPTVLDQELKSQKANGIDHYFLYESQRNEDLVLKSDRSKRSLTIKSSYPGINIYTSNYPDPKVPIQTGRLLGLHSAIALEPQYPMRLNPMTNSPVYPLKKGVPYHHEIHYVLRENA